jgi:hypothetical protein
MTSKYQMDDSELIGSLSPQHKFITRQPFSKIETKKIEASQLNYFTPDHTHY